MRKLSIRLLLVFVPLLAAGCVTAPAEIRNAPAGPPVNVVRQNPDQYVGKQVRWGGVIASIENQATRTELQIVARPLHNSGRPVDTSNSLGRFIVQAPGFLEPTEYEKGRELTVVGSITGGRTQNIDQHPYLFPVVTARSLYLWEEEPRYAEPYYPYPYPYYWDPFYPWGFGSGFYGSFYYRDYPRHYRPPHYRHDHDHKGRPGPPPRNKK